MTFADRHIVETYSSLFEGLNSVSKLELIERLSRCGPASSFTTPMLPEKYSAAYTVDPAMAIQRGPLPFNGTR